MDLARFLGRGQAGIDDDEKEEQGMGRPGDIKGPLEGPVGRAGQRGHFSLSLTSFGSVISPTVSTPAFLAISMTSTMKP